ncbi:MAG: restriction endonuclease subunit S [Heyndrickxia coagulans]|jgi:type I restriction enzyme S subunit
MEQKNMVPKRRFKEFQNTSAWEQRRIGEIADIVRGASPRPIQDPKWFDEKSDIGWLRIADVTEQNGRIHYLKQRISKDGQEKTRVLTEPHLLLSIAATVGKPVVNYVKTGVHDGFLIFLNPKFDREFMFQWLEMFRPKWQKYGQPGSQVNLNSNLVKNQEIMLPSEEEQKKIGRFFERLDNLITLHQRKLEKTKALKSAYLSEMFPAEGERVPKRRFAGFTQAWEQRKLGDMVEEIIDNRGKTPPIVSSSQYPLLEVASLGNDTPDYSKVTKYVDKETYKNWFRQHIKKGDILFATVGNTGVTAMMDGAHQATIAQNIVGFRPNEKFNSEFMLQMFNLPGNLKKAKRIEMGAVQPSVKVSQLIDVKYSVPSKEEQVKVGTFFANLDHLITLHQRKLEKLQNIKKAYLNEMFV